MTYQKPNNFYELLIELDKLCKRVFALKCNISKNIGKNIAETQDARVVFLNAIQENLSVSIMLFSIYIDARKNHPNDAMLRKVMNSPPSLKTVSETEIVKRDETSISEFLKLSLLVKIHFQLENFFNNIHHALKEKKLYKFMDVLNALAKEVESDEHQWKLINDAFTALAYIRNSLHNNGIHHPNRGKMFKAMIGGEMFSFNPGEAINCASWHHILLLLITIIPFIEKLLYYPVIEKKDYIRDDFSYAYETTI